MADEEFDPNELDDALAMEAATAAEGDIDTHSSESTELTMREIRAVQLRSAGADYNQIASALGYANRSGAFKAVRRALQRWGSEAVEELRILELHRLDVITQKLWPRVIGSPAKDNADGTQSEPVAPDPRAMELYLKVSARRAKLLGLDAPTALELTGPDGGAVKIQSVEDYERFVGLVGDIVDLEVSDEDGVARAPREDEDGGGDGEQAAPDQVLPPRAD